MSQIWDTSLSDEEKQKHLNPPGEKETLECIMYEYDSTQPSTFESTCLGGTAGPCGAALKGRASLTAGGGANRWSAARCNHARKQEQSAEEPATSGPPDVALEAGASPRGAMTTEELLVVTPPLCKGHEAGKKRKAHLEEPVARATEYQVTPGGPNIR
ncbi:hypothetical protein EYF80_053543 [Liparis tanakae]|uniref:Uncharacterized protein n=1 Tax=Liparis tanakae TaxID=230148 RepID=A0A4Z2F4Y6_9TELE|nr:hypothetical protein EYF80_053543 [Liparis tanakae]